MRFIKKRDYKLSVSDGSVNVLSICKKSYYLRSILLQSLSVAAE